MDSILSSAIVTFDYIHVLKIFIDPSVFKGDFRFEFIPVSGFAVLRDELRYAFLGIERYSAEYIYTAPWIRLVRRGDIYRGNGRACHSYSSGPSEADTFNSGRGFLESLDIIAHVSFLPPGRDV